MESIKKNQLVTLEDLELLKQDLLTAIRQIIRPNIGVPAKKWVKSAEARKLIGVSPGKLQIIRDSGLLANTSF
jgi:hypothetical protein